MEQQILKAKANHSIAGNLTEAQIAKLVELANEKTTLTFKINGYSIDITIGKWQKENLNRLYINKSHSQKAGKVFGSMQAICWIDPANGSIHAPTSFSQLNEYGCILILAELFGLAIYFDGGVRAVAE